MTHPDQTQQAPARPEHLCPATRHAEPVPGQPIWCRPCQERIIRALGRLPELAAALFARTLSDGGKIAASGQSDTTRKATRAGSPSGSPAWDAVDEIVQWAADAEDMLREHLGHARITRTRIGAGDRIVHATHLTSSISYLTTWSAAWLSWDDVATNPDLGGQRALQLERRAERAAGLDRLTHRLPAPCPSCDRRALVRDDGSEQVDCRACGRSWPESDYRRLVLILASEVRA